VTTDTALQWINRIVGHGDEAPEALRANPLNFRVHPQAQAEALLGIIQEIGFIQDVIVNKRTGLVVDGHLRVALAIQQHQATIPVKYVDLSPEEERAVLLFFDHLTSMAVLDKAKLEDLMKEIQAQAPALQEALAQMATDNKLAPPDIQFKEYDEDVEKEVQYVECPNCGHRFPK
jgi:hypothetical protein